jgi:hypothetical protein
MEATVAVVVGTTDKHLKEAQQTAGIAGCFLPFSAALRSKKPVLPLNRLC